MSYRIGLDFDNTLISYDAPLRDQAARLGLEMSAAIPSKRGIREAIRQLPDGERHWQQVQAFVYTSGMKEATLIDGVAQFLSCCRSAGAQVWIVSHKGEHAAADPHGVKLREAALAWMRAQRFFEPDGLGLAPARVYFEGTREAKVGRIRALGCTHFIDDLEETFAEPSFPASTQRILFDPHGHGCQRTGVVPLHSWEAIRDHLFRAS